MPSPFPGLDPFLESQEWEDFHTTWNTVVSECLAPRVEPCYVVRIKRRVYAEHPRLEELREAYLVIRDCETREVVTVLETLSPPNKRAGSEERREYLRRRDDVLRSESNLVELDLLRGRQRLLCVTPLPPGDYSAIVSRRRRRPRADVYAWSLRQPLPAIPIPLKPGDPEVPLELQTAFTTVYDRARYDLSLDYERPLIPPLPDPDAQWVRQILPQRGA